MAGRKSKYTPETARIIIDAIRCGDTYKVAAIKAGIDEDTLKCWRDNLPDFSDKIKAAKDDYNRAYRNELLPLCRKSLRDLILGYDTEETKTKYENDRNGNPRIKQQTITAKHVAPNTAAIIFALTNLDPENWKNRQSTDVNGKVATNATNDVSLANVPDDLLSKVIDAIKK